MPYTNRLAGAQSPYLLQHQHNPVAWYPWGEEAFAKAQAEDKPIFLSIGYATCHWCHVMERESFEDEAVAALMNEAFVSIKVDREERPDIDNVYMTVCQLMSGRCGWPLNVLLTPQGRPFYVATYVPKETNRQRLGMLDLVPRVRDLWQNRRDELLASADEVFEAVAGSQQPQRGERALDVDALHAAFQQLADRFDEERGGFGAAPKFPAPHTLLFLLRYHHRTGNAEALDMVTTTLDHMRRGGLFDHVGYGFHRYSTDREWLLPHFEKMLYDQALLMMAYTEAFQVTQNPEYAATVRAIADYVRRDLTDAAGGFYAAEDADSEGVEGKFYVWTEAELAAVLGDEALLARQVFNTTADGNFLEEATGHRTGANILHLKKPLRALAAALDTPPDALAERLETMRQRLLAARAQRIRPTLDDKVLTDWNGLMLAALARAAQVFAEPLYEDMATHAATFLLATMREDETGRLQHRYRDGVSGIDGHLDDYAFLTWGLLDLYEATFDISYLQKARELLALQQQHFWDEVNDGFFLTADDAEALIVRPKEWQDGALPSGNAASLLNLIRLARFTGDTALEQQAHTLLAAAPAVVAQQPSAFTGLLLGLDYVLGPAHEVVVAGEGGAEDTEAMLAAIRTPYVPNKVVLFRDASAETPPIVQLAPYTQANVAPGGQATAYVCEQFVCQAPTTDLEELRQALLKSNTA